MLIYLFKEKKVKVTQYELIEFADEQNLIVFGKSELITSKMKSLQRLIQKGLIPKPKWEGGNLYSFWENDSEIKDRLIWIDEKRKEKLSYRQMKEELESGKTPRPESLIAEDLISTIDNLLKIDYDNSKVLFIKAQMLYKLGKSEEAVKILQSFETNCDDNKELLFIVYEEMARMYFYIDKKKELATCQKLISLAEEMNDNEKLGCAYIDMGNCIADNDIDKAYDYFNRSIELLQESDFLGEAYASIYYVQKRKRNFSESEESLKKAIEIFKKTNNKLKESISKANLGILYSNTNHLSKAMNLLQEAYHTISQLHDMDSEAEIAGNIGKIYKQRGLFSKAIEHFRQAYHIASQIKNPKAQKVWLKMMSEVYKEMGNIKKSEFFLKESKKVEEQITSTPNPFSYKEKGNSESSLSLKRGTEGELDKSNFAELIKKKQFPD